MEKETGGSLGLGVGVDLNLKLNLIKNLVQTLNDALKETGSQLSDTMSEIYQKIKEMGPDKLKSEAQQGGFEDEYNQLVSKLQEAADRGEDESRKLLHQMGETTEHAGQKMKDASHKDEPVS